MSDIKTNAVILCEGPLVDLCIAINQAVRDEDGRTDCCIFAAAVAMDVLRALGRQADVMRVEAAVFPEPTGHGVIVGSFGDGSRRPAAQPGMWAGHLVAVVDGKWLLDATLDQTKLAPPMVIEFPPWWLEGGKGIFVRTDSVLIRYTAFPQKGGYKSAPDFRPGRRRDLVEALYNEWGNTRPIAAAVAS